MLFAAVHKSALGTKRTIAAPQHFVRYWTNNGQSSALARDASVATIEFFWKEKFVSTALVPAASRCGTECGIASICSNESPIKSIGCDKELAEREGFEPPIRLPVCRISSAVHSTALPPLRSRKQPAKAACGRPLSNQARPERQETGKGRATYIERPGKGAGRRPAKRCSKP